MISRILKGQALPSLRANLAPRFERSPRRAWTKVDAGDSFDWGKDRAPPLPHFVLCN